MKPTVTHVEAENAPLSIHTTKDMLFQSLELLQTYGLI